MFFLKGLCVFIYLLTFNFDRFIPPHPIYSS